MLHSYEPRIDQRWMKIIWLIDTLSLKFFADIEYTTGWSLAMVIVFTIFKCLTLLYGYNLH